MHAPLGALAALALAASVSPCAAADGLNTRAAAASGRFFGTAVSTTMFNDAAAAAVAANSADFGQWTCENEMKPDATEPSQGVFRFDAADAIVAKAEEAGIAMRCHTLVWHSQVPAWMENGGFDNATLIEVMEAHIAGVVGHFKGKCYAWDVVNEALNEDGSFRESFWYKTIGPAYIPLAFAAAARADPDARLHYNDYNLESGGAKTAGALEIVRLVQAYGAPIHGVGFQAHLSAGTVGPASRLAATFEKFTALDVDVAVTELDIGVSDSSAFAQQATDYGAVVTACAGVARCVGITAWGVSDKYSWRASDMPLLWDTNLGKKAAYTAALEAWGAASKAPATSAAAAPTSTIIATVPTATSPTASTSTPATSSSPASCRARRRAKRSAGRV